MRQIGDKVFVVIHEWTSGHTWKPILSEGKIIGIRVPNEITVIYEVEIPGDCYGKLSVNKLDTEVYDTRNEMFSALWETRLRFDNKQEVKNDD